MYSVVYGVIVHDKCIPALVAEETVAAAQLVPGHAVPQLHVTRILYAVPHLVVGEKWRTLLQVHE